MGLIAISNIADGTSIDANDVNSPLNTIANEFNGNIDQSNLADNAVGTNELQSNSITTSKIADNQITYSKLLSTIFGGQVQTLANSGTAGGTIYYINLGGLKICWGETPSYSYANVATISKTVVFPTSFFSSAPRVLQSQINPVTSPIHFPYASSITANDFTLNSYNASGATASIGWSYVAIGT